MKHREQMHKKIQNGLALLGCVLSFCANAQSSLDLNNLRAILEDPVRLEETKKKGHRASFFCANCHGETGTALSDEVPNLSGQNIDYLFEQTRKFATGERKDAFMEGLIRLLSDEEILQISVFYNQSKVEYRKADPAKKEERARGKKIYALVCQRCHGASGMGDGVDGKTLGNVKIARIAGQPAPYVNISLKRYRDGTGERKDKLMMATTQALKDQDINDLAEFISQLR